jgi:hypothetical protein
VPITVALKEPTTIEYRLRPEDHEMAADRIYIFKVTESR